MIRNMIVVLLLAGMVTASTPAKTPDFSGKWLFDYSRSTAGMDWPPDTFLIIRQTDDRVEMERWAREVQFSSGAYLTDGKYRKLYSTKTETAFLSAKWRKDELVVTIEHRMQWEIGEAATPRDIDSWKLTDQGQTLIHKTSEGKTYIFHKAPAAAAAQPTPAPSKSEAKADTKAH